MDDRKIKIAFIVLDICLVLYAVLWYLQCCQLFHQRGGADKAREQLNSAATVQQQVTSGITDAKDATENITGEITEGRAGVEQAGITAGYIEREIYSSGELIEDCQRVISGVRQRGTKD